MTEPTDDENAAAVDTNADDQAGAAGRDPLTTDDGLAAVAAGPIPETGACELVDGVQPPTQPNLLDNPGLDVDDDGVDPCTELASPAEED
jgi:hypothetical protein